MDFDLSPPTPPAATSPTSNSPIADLSYRNYDGPLQTRAIRWWIVALATLRGARKSAGFWIVSALLVLIYGGIGVIVYYTSGLPATDLNPLFGDKHHRYANVFFNVTGIQSLLLFIVALIVGAGSIASDNKANALLVYLSKPLTKGDYLLGKWMGIFIALFSVALVPALGLYTFLLLSYLKEGFLTNEPLLLLRIVAASAVPAVLHASLIVGCSAWSKSSRIAGATYASIYFITGILVMIVWGLRHRGDLTKGVLERHISISGVIGGLEQNLYDITQKIPSWQDGMQRTVGPPSAVALLILGGVLVAVGIAAARAKIRAVEVVRG